MIRPKWPFTALQRRCLSISRPVGGATPPRDELGTSLKANKGEIAALRESMRRAHLGSKAAPQQKLGKGLAQQKKAFAPRAKNLEDNTMVTISGLSPSLRISDFNRIAVQGLSDWNSAIEEASQDRDPWTLEPLGRWRINFGTSAAALAFKDKINRLHSLSSHKMHSASGLWESTVPTHLQSREGQADLKEEVDAFTVAPGSLPRLKMSRNGRNWQWRWEHHARRIISRTKYPTSNVVVLVTLQRPCFTAGELEETMKERDEARNFAWKISSPYHLFDSLDDPYMKLDANTERVALRENSDFMTKVKSRFAIVCVNNDEAWRFIKRWNQCLIEGESGTTGRFERTMINVSLIELQQT